MGLNFGHLWYCTCGHVDSQKKKKQSHVYSRIARMKLLCSRKKRQNSCSHLPNICIFFVMVAYGLPRFGINRSNEK